MPVVPFTPGPKTKSGRQLPPSPAEPFALMAAAQIHSEGRLIKPEDKPSE